MVLSLLVLALIIAVALFQSLHGLFSAVIMLVLTICCVAFSFGTYEWVAINWLSKWEGREDYAFAIALALTFGLPLLILRLAFDRLLPRSPLLPAIMDKVGAGACGIITALLLVGMMVTSLLMLPLNGNLLAYARIDRPSKEQQDDKPDPEAPDLEAKEAELWLTPDRFAVGTAGLLSNGVFGSERKLARDNPDIVQAIGWVNCTRGDVTRFAPPDCISVTQTSLLDWVYTFTPGSTRRNRPPEFTPINPKAGHKFRMLAVDISASARDKKGRLPFTLRQFRLVGETPTEVSWQQYFPIALQSGEENFSDYYVKNNWTRWGDWHIVDEVYEPLSANPNQVKIVFELPDGFEPVYLAFKTGAVTEVSFDDSTASAAPGTRDSMLAEASRRDGGRRPSGSAETVPTSGRGGRVRKYTSKVGRSFFGNQMPITLRNVQKLSNADVSRGALKNGHLVGLVAEQESGGGRPIGKFSVPSDKRLLHLNVKNLQAGSLFGKIKNKAISTIQNFIVHDDRGREYKIIGKYAIAIVGGEEVIEVQYFKDQAGTIGGVGKFSQITESSLKRDYDLVFLFLVEPGARITAFGTGSSASRRDDLTSEQLVAPD